MAAISVSSEGVTQITVLLGRKSVTPLSVPRKPLQLTT
jgi:hypothetical protein